MPRSDKHTIRQITERGVEDHANRLGLSLAPDEVEDYQALVNGTLEAFESVLEYQVPQFQHQEIEYSRRPTGWRPDADEDPLNAWIYRCEVKGANEGPLSGYNVGLKDSIALAGYPLTAGSDVLSGFAPTIDATVVRRLLDAGATIIGKQNMESFAFSGSGDTSDFGPVRNPYSDEHLAGGSSSGSAAAVASGDCDVSLGTDQAGSVRIPSACCGTVGLKPTSGLVPYTGTIPLDLGIDHLGPIASSVNVVAKTMEVIAGEDVVGGIRLDPRQPRGIEAENYSSGLEDGVDDITIGVLEDGFGWDFSDPGIDDAVRDAVSVLSDEGADTQPVSMKHHRILSSAAGVVATIGGSRSIEDAGITRGSDGWYWADFADIQYSLVDARTDKLPPSVKQALLTAAHVIEEHGISSYAVAQNIALDAERRYYQLLETCDVLAMPTIVVPPMTFDPDLDRVEATSREWTLVANTAPTDLTGHPAISVPCAMVDGLPVGMMLIGSHFDESTLLRVAARFERTTEWKSR